MHRLILRCALLGSAALLAIPVLADYPSPTLKYMYGLLGTPGAAGLNLGYIDLAGPPYNVVCNGANDNASAINAALLAAPQNSYLRLPPGVCVFKSLLQFPFNANSFTFGGAGKDATELLYTGSSTTTDLIDVGTGVSGGTAPYGITIRDLRLWSSTKMTGGTALHLIRCTKCDIDNIEANWYAASTNTLWNAVWIDQPDLVNIDHFAFAGKNDALRVSALGINTPQQYDVFASHGKLSESAVGLHVGGGIDNVFFDQIIDTYNVVDFLDDNAIVAQPNQDVWLGPQFKIEWASNFGAQINDVDCNSSSHCIVEIGGSSTWNAYDGVYVQNFPNGNLIISAAAISNNNHNGVHVADASSYVSISQQTQITRNSQYGIAADFSWNNLLSMGQVFANTSGQISPLVGVMYSGGSPETPTIASGFGTSPSVYQSSGTRAFTLNVGGGGVATSGTLNFPLSTTGWTCTSHDYTTIATANTPTSVTFGKVGGGAWTSGYAVQILCSPR